MASATPMNETQLGSFEIPDTIFDEIERKCGVHLSKTHRKLLLLFIFGHVILFWHFAGAPHRLEIAKYLFRLERRLADAHEAVANLTVSADKTAEMANKWLGWVLPLHGQPQLNKQALKRDLEAVRLASGIFRSLYLRKGAPRADRKRMMIWMYADFFEMVGGKASASYKGDKDCRDSPFLRLLHIIDGHLPVEASKEFRPGLDEMAKKVLAERKRSGARNKATPPDFLPFL